MDGVVYGSTGQKRCKRVLIIRPGAIGDTLLSFPVLQALRSVAGPCHLSFVGNRALFSLAQACGVADVCFDYQEPCWSQLFLTSPPPSSSLRSPLRDVLDRCDLAVAWIRDEEGIVSQNLTTWGVSQVIVAPGRPMAGERIHVTTHLARTLEIPWIETEGLIRLQLMLPSIDIHSQFQTPPIALHCGSGGASKCWSVASFAQIVHRLWDLDQSVLLLAGPADQERLSTLLTLIGTPPSPHLLRVLVNEPLLNVASQIQHCQLYLGNDSGLTHLAALLGIPTLVLFGPTDPAIWQPCGPAVMILYEPDLHKLSVERVWAAVEDIRSRHLHSLLN